jgi:translation initiation factor eIF-2B subunit alpha
MQAYSKTFGNITSHIPLASGCELFTRYVTRCFLDFPDFDQCIREVLARGETFAGLSLAARDKIAMNGYQFVRDGCVILTHGFSRVVSAVLLKAQEKQIHFEVIVLEGRPDGGGAKAAKLYAAAGIPVTVVLDSAMGYFMERVDCVLCGAEGVVENGGVVNKVGTYTLGITAKALGKPFYVAAESYKFARLYPLNNADLPEMGDHKPLSFVDTTAGEVKAGEVDNVDEGRRATIKLPKEVQVQNPIVDFTPAEYITLLFTDLGVLTPSAVSDELIRLYQ